MRALWQGEGRDGLTYRVAVAPNGTVWARSRHWTSSRWTYWRQLGPYTLTVTRPEMGGRHDDRTE